MLETYFADQNLSTLPHLSHAEIFFFHQAQKAEVKIVK